MAGPGGNAVRSREAVRAPWVADIERGGHMRLFTRRLTAGSVVAALAVVGFASPAMAGHSEEPPPGDYGSAGDPTITVPINDSEAGGTYYQPFERAYAGETPDGTPVYVYVPTGALAGVEGVHSLDPSFDHDPDDEFIPCTSADPADYALTEAQI